MARMDISQISSSSATESVLVLYKLLKSGGRFPLTSLCLGSFPTDIFYLSSPGKITSFAFHKFSEISLSDTTYTKKNSFVIRNSEWAK